MDDRSALAPIDEPLAWRLLRAVPAARAGAPPTVRVTDHARSTVWLQVTDEGAWHASVPVTDPARQLLDLYLPLRRAEAFVVGQVGQSLDGRIATVEGHSHYVTGPADIVRLHRLRALADVVVVGAGTVAADDPRLTVRKAEGDNPVRVVLDPHGRVPPERAVFTDGAARTIVVCEASATPTTIAGAERLTLPTRRTAEGRATFAPAKILAALREQGLRRILVEGGGITVSRFLEAGALTRLHVTVAPLLIGSGRPALTLPPIASLDQALRPPSRVFRLGDDLLFDLDLDQTPGDET